VLRDFSGVLTHSLCAEALLRQFLMLLREILGVNRAAVFLRPPPSLVAGGPAVPETRRLRAACAIGLAPGLLEHFELSVGAELVELRGDGPVERGICPRRLIRFN